jgi:3-keto-L-gulonate-6-phosphate decarboxylase
MINVVDPLRVLLRLKDRPDVVELHMGRDEETVKGNMIEYRHIRRVKSKYDVIISAAGGVDLKAAQSAVFNGAQIVVVNIVEPDDPWKGIKSTDEIRKIATEFLKAVK